MLNRRKETPAEEVSTKKPLSSAGGIKKRQDLIPTGSVMLNLACSDQIDGGYGLGKIVNLIGDSSTGKTLLALSMLAEVAGLKRFNDYRLIFDDAEMALEFDMEYLFGKKIVKRIETDIISDTIEEWYGNVLRTIKKGKPFIYVLDSFDSITSEAEQERGKKYEKTKAQLAAERKGKKKKGSYKTEKPRMASEILRVIGGKIADNKSLVFIISQTRDNIGFGAMFQPKTRSGGKALKFYCTHEIWLAVGKAVKSKERDIGNAVMAKVSKNKLTGKKREIEFPIYYDYGADDISSCVDFLVKEEYWKKAEKKIKVPEFSFEGSRRRLIYHIEDETLEKDLFNLTGTVWNEIEESLRLDRKKKYE